MQGINGKHKLRIISFLFFWNSMNEDSKAQRPITGPSGRARIQIQVCVIPNLFSEPQYYIAFPDKDFGYDSGPCHSICCAIKYVRVSCIQSCKNLSDVKSPIVIKTCNYLLCLNSSFGKVPVTLIYKQFLENATEVLKKNWHIKCLI